MRGTTTPATTTRRAKATRTDLHSPSAMRAERVLAELNRLRQDLDKDPKDPEWFTLHHVFCFVSYKMADFQKYIDENVKPGDEPDFG